MNLSQQRPQVLLRSDQYNFHTKIFCKKVTPRLTVQLLSKQADHIFPQCDQLCETRTFDWMEQQKWFASLWKAEALL